MKRSSFTSRSMTTYLPPGRTLVPGLISAAGVSGSGAELPGPGMAHPARVPRSAAAQRARAACGMAIRIMLSCGGAFG